MAAPLPTVFLSYRRHVSSFIARAVLQDLRQHGYDVFMDVESIDGGQFATIILAQIAARAHFLVILTHGSLEGCQEPDDWLRREIECALGLGRIVIPILVDDFCFDDNARVHLTGKLCVLPDYNGVTLHQDYFDEAMERLRTRFLKLPAQGIITSAPPQDAPVVQQKIDEAAHQPAPTKQELSAEGYFNQGLARAARGDRTGAIVDYTEAIRLKPQYASAYCSRGVARGALGDRAGAFADYTRAIRLNPQDASAYYGRGVARGALGDRAGALADYTEAIRLNPQDVSAYYSRGITRGALGDLTGAIADYTEAIRLKPQYANAYHTRGIIRGALDDRAGALADYKQYLALSGARPRRYRKEVEQRIRTIRAASQKFWRNLWR
jgi:tetratricopeptide (TPR) repeat protein